MAKNKYYAVKIGLVPGIYTSWEECKNVVVGYPGAIYKGFRTEEESLNYMNNTTNKIPQDLGICKDCQDDGLIAYVDGSFDASNNIYSCGVVILNGNSEKYLTKTGRDPELIDMRNIAGEILGSMLAMEYAKNNNIKKITIYHDYQGISSWCLGDWKAKKKGTIDYKNYYDEISKSVEILFKKVKGHTGVFYNDIADALAKGALGIEIKKSVQEHISKHTLIHYLF